jgi:hypothetical protein
MQAFPMQGRSTSRPNKNRLNRARMQENLVCSIRIRGIGTKALGTQLPMGMRIPIMGIQMPIMGTHIPMGTQMSIMGMSMPIKGTQLPIAGMQLPIAGMQLPIAGMQLPMGTQTRSAAMQTPIADLACTFTRTALVRLFPIARLSQRTTPHRPSRHVLPTLAIRWSAAPRPAAPPPLYAAAKRRPRAPVGPSRVPQQVMSLTLGKLAPSTACVLG